MRFVSASEIHVKWITERINLLKVEDANGIAAESDNGEILCVCMMDTWTRGSVQIHIAIDNPIALKNHTFLKEVFNYIFNTAERETVIGLVASDNDKALRFDKKIGFTEICRIKDGHDIGIDTVVLQLCKDDCRWIKRKEEAA